MSVNKLISEFIGRHRPVIVVLAAMVVFVITYLLILPASTLDQKTASEQGGIDITEQAEQQTEPVGDAQSGETAETPESGVSGGKDPEESSAAGNAADSDKPADVKESGKEVDSADSREGSAKEKGGDASDNAKETEPAEKDKKDEEKSAAKAEKLTFDGKGYDIIASANADANLPADTELISKEIGKSNSDYEKYLEKTRKALEKSGSKEQIKSVRFYDISLEASGEDIQPDAPIDVNISYDTAIAMPEKGNVRIVHFDSEKKGIPVPEILKDSDVDPTIKNGKMTGTAFEAEGFSVYGVVYTVDFHYDADGQSYEYSMEGGGFISLSRIVTATKIAGKDDAAEFVSNIEDVKFSDSSLLWVGKAGQDTTVGALKKENKLDCRYSDDLTKKQIREIDAQTVKAGDWALISLQPFTSEETLTVIMKNGDRFAVKVTDAQIDPDNYENVIYTYTVNDTNAGEINLVNSSGNLSGQDNTGTTVTDGLNNAKDKASRFARAVPNNGYRFVRWTNEGKDYKNGANDIRPSKAELQNGEYTSDTFVANFIANNDYLITFETTKGGRIKDNLTSLTYSQIINTAPDIFAIPDQGYRCLGWRNQYGQMVTTDRYLYSSNIAREDGVYTAVFEEIEDKNIYYRANGTYGTVSTEHEIVHGDDDPIGSVATPKDGYQFISWVNDHGETVWPLEEFEPFADLIYDGATYTAVFESAAYSRYFMMQADETEHGYIESPQYENSVNGRIVSMYIRDDGTIPAQLKAVANEGWLFDHWEVNGVEIEELGDTIPAGYDFSGFELRDGWNILMAYYKENPVVLTHTITYKANTGGTVRGIANLKIGNDYVDQWTGTNTSAVRGATATANTNWTFTGWLEKLEDGSYKVVSNDSTFVPSGNLLKDATYYAAFRRNESQKGMVGYNMNVIDMPVKWNGVQDIVIASGAGAPMYYDTNNGNYFARGQKFSIDTTIPEADGYYFLGWYNKDRNKWTSTNSGSDNGNCPVGQGGHPKTEGDIIPRGSDTTLDGLKLTNIVFPMGGSGSRYTFEAMFAGIEASSKRVPYDGAAHQLIGVEKLLKGTVEETERFRTQLATLEQNGGYRLDHAKYQLLDENGNPVGEPTTSFERTKPGKYKVRVYADGIFAGEEFRVYKDVTLEIYAAKVVIKKYWLQDSYSVRPDDLDVDVFKYDTKNKGYVQNPDTNVGNRNRAKQQAENITQSSAGSGTNVASVLSGYSREEPEWSKHGSVWTKEYDDVLVRNLGYSETDQNSGYDLFFAEETVPAGYTKTVENWTRSDKQDGTDYLTTTITFRNEYNYEPLTLHAVKQWADGNTAAGHPSVTFYLMRSVNGAPFEKLEGSEKVIPAGASGDDLNVTWTDLPQRNNAKTEHYTYKIAEVHLDGFETEITGSVKDGYTVRNTDTRIDIPALKVDKYSGTEPLENAEFTIAKQKEGQYKPYTTANFPESPYADAAACKAVSNGQGRLSFIGLSDGTYQLAETGAPSGYQPTDAKIIFTVADGEVSLSDGAGIATYEKINEGDADKTLKVTNEPYTSLKLKKQVTINDFDPDHSSVTDKTVADGTYVINIAGVDNTPTAGKSYTAKITITNGAAASATIKDNTVPGATDRPASLANGVLEIPDMIPGKYTVTEEEDSKTVLSALNSSDESAEEDLENRTITVTLSGEDSTVQLITLTNNYADNSETDIAHISVRKTFEGLKPGMKLPEGFNIKVKVTADIDGTARTFNYTLTGATDTANGVIWNSSVNDNGDVVWNWRIAIRGLNPDARVEVEEINYQKPGYDVETTVNPANSGGDGTSYTGTVSASTTVASIEPTVIPQKNRLTFSLNDLGGSATIFIAKLVPDQKSMVISKNKLNLSERKALEEQLKRMPIGGNWYNNKPPLYYSFEEAANNQIIVRNGSVVTYSDENGGQIVFSKKCQWSMAATTLLTYQEGRPADVNFVNSYSEHGAGIDIVKVDKNQRTTKLSGAKFTLTKLDESTTPGNIIYKKIPGTDNLEKQVESAATDENGATAFTNLTGGYYEIKETQLPDGYVLNGDGCFYVRVEDGVAKYLAVSSDQQRPITEWETISATGAEDLIQLTAGSADDPSTPNADETRNTLFSVGNESGTALPNSGGPGTVWIYILGSILLLGSCIILVSRRRTRHSAS